jgi:hypothetical protein
MTLLTIDTVIKRLQDALYWIGQSNLNKSEKEIKGIILALENKKGKESKCLT